MILGEGTLVEGLESAAQWGVTTGMSVSLLILAVLFIRRPVAKYFGAHAAYALWALPLIRLFMPQMTVPFLRKPSAELYRRRETISEVAPVVTAPSAPTTEFDYIATVATEFEPIFNSSGLGLAQILTLIWLSVAVLWLGFQLYKQARFTKSMVNESKVPSKSLIKAIDKATASVNLKSGPIVKLNARISGPMVSGVLNPFILLPSDFETRFTPEQQHFALVHEMSHIKRRDLWAAMASLAFRALFWPNPLVHYAAHKLRSDQESSCDASVLKLTGGDLVTHSYAQTLVYAAKAMKHTRATAPLGLALADDDKNNANISDPFNKETNA